MNKILFTAPGYEKLQKNLEEAIVKRPEVLKSLVRSREMGDLSENGAYKSAKFELGQLDRMIRTLQDLVKKAQIIKPTNNNYVQIGHTVTLRRINN